LTLVWIIKRFSGALGNFCCNLWLETTYWLAKLHSHLLAQGVDFQFVNVCVFIFVFRLSSYYHKHFKNAILLNTYFIVFFTTNTILPLLFSLNTFVVFITTKLSNSLLFLAYACQHSPNLSYEHILYVKYIKN
jgi:hypothetical protein